jgi:glycine/D-amino acid oxidase-like deaminating enzyme
MRACACVYNVSVNVRTWTEKTAGSASRIWNWMYSKSFPKWFAGTEHTTLASYYTGRDAYDSNEEETERKKVRVIVCVCEKQRGGEGMREGVREHKIQRERARARERASGINVRGTHFADARIHGAVCPSLLADASKPAAAAPKPCI